MKPRPTCPFHEIAVNFARTEDSMQFLIITDYYSDWPEIIQMGQNTRTSHLIATLLNSFGRNGVPDVDRSDQRPQFMSHKLNEFAQDWRFQCIMLSPNYPQAMEKLNQQ